MYPGAEEEDEDGNGGGEVGMEGQGGQEGDLGRQGVAQPGEGAHGHAQGGHEEGHAPAQGAGVRGGNDLGQAALERFQVLTGYLRRRTIRANYFRGN